jgi:hypothetical protein
MTIEVVLAWWKTASDIWHSIQNIVVLLGMIWVVHRLKTERGKLATLIDNLSERIETIGQLTKAAQATAEAALARNTGSGGETTALAMSNWETVRVIWQEVRDRIELKIGDIDHKSVRAKYSKFARYSYREVINTLHSDGVVSSSKAWIALQNMNSNFLRLRTKTSAANSNDVEQFQQWLKDINGSLPRLPIGAQDDASASSIESKHRADDPGLRVVSR